MKKFIYTLFIALIISSIAPYKTVTGQTTNIQYKKIELNIFPNPATINQDINLEVAMQENQQVSFFVYDFSGKLVKETKEQSPMFGDDNIIVKIHIADEGVYFVKVLIQDLHTNFKTSVVKKFYVK